MLFVSQSRSAGVENMRELMKMFEAV